MTDETLTPRRAEALIRAYGAEPQHWPLELRESLRRCIEATPHLRERVASERELDRVLAEHQITSSLSVAEVLAYTQRHSGQHPVREPNPTESVLESFLEWLCFGGRGTVWRGGLAAGLVLVLGMGFGVLLPQEEDWEISEQYVFAPIEGGEVDG